MANTVKTPTILKREETFIKKYGAAYNLQRPEVKAKLSESKLTGNAREKLLDRDWLYNEYIVKNVSTRKIADALGVNPTTVTDYVRKYDIKKRK